MKSEATFRAHRARWAIASMAMLTGACSTAQTQVFNDVPTFANSKAGMPYFLPMRLMTLDVAIAPKDLDKIIKAVDAAKKGLPVAEEAEGKAKGAKSNIDKEVTRLEAIATPTSADQAALVDARKEQARATAVAANATAAVEAARNAIAINEAQQRAAEKDPKGCTYAATLKTAAVVPDTRRTLVFNPVHNWFRDDDGTLTTTPGGLLTSTKIAAKDRTGDILAELAGALSVDDSKITTKSLVEINVDCTMLPSFSYTFDPTDTHDVNSALSGRQIPFRVGLAPVVAGGLPTSTNDLLPNAGTLNGILYRVETPALVALIRCMDTDCGSSVLSSASMVSLPQAGPVGRITMDSSAFVQREYNLEFDNGMLKSWTYNQPSEVMQIVRLPVQVAKAIVSVPAEILSIKVDISSDKVTLQEAEQKAREFELRKALFAQCLAAAGDDPEKGKACLGT